MTHDAHTAPPATDQRFSALGLPPATLATLEQLGYASMTPIQAAALPIALAGHDLIAQAKTGSGKTAVFGLALLATLQRRFAGVQALVLCPTRELAEQVGAEIRRLARADENVKVLVLCGGAPIRPQLTSLAHGAHVVVGTPGRVLDHLSRGSLVLEALRTLVLDEADRMLDMGFRDDMAAVAKRCPKGRQTLFFSATYPADIAALGRELLREPKEVRLEEQHAPTKIRQRFYKVEEQERLEVVARLLEHYRPERTLAFCNTRERCRGLLGSLEARGFVALALHGDLEQRERDQVLVQFANRSCSVLVATDVAARGLDVKELEAVINVELTPDPEVHLHRIGRTGRVDQEGWAFSLAGPGEFGRAARIEAAQGSPLEWRPTTELARAAPRTGGSGGKASNTATAGPLVPPMVTLQIQAGRKDKLRAGDVLGALTKDVGLRAEQVGRIHVNPLSAYVAVERGVAGRALEQLLRLGIKGRHPRVRRL